jgi:hypothetical protein
MVGAVGTRARRDEEGSMARTSPQDVVVQDHGLVEVRTAELDGITADFLVVKQPVDMAFMLKSLPDGRCQCSHFGVVLKGGFAVQYADRVETVNEGDWFHMTPGHVPTYQVGTELIQFSPTDDLRATDEAIHRSMQELQGT